MNVKETGVNSELEAAGKHVQTPVNTAKLHQKSGHLCPPPRVTEDYSYFESKLSRNKNNIAKRELALVGGIGLQYLSELIGRLDLQFLC